MRFTFVSLALLALAHALAPGVYGAPTVDSDPINPLAVRQDISGLVGLLSSLVESLLGSAQLSPADVTKVVEQALQSAAGLLPRALPSSSGAASPLSPPSSTTSSSTTTTTSVGLATGTVSNVPSVSLSTPRPPSATLSRMRRQLTTPLPVSIPAVPSTPTPPGAQSSHSSMQSVSASVPSSQSATSTSTSSNPTPSASRAR